MGGFAWVTLATNDSYSLGALVLAHSLKQTGTAHQLAVLVSPGVTNVMRQKLATVYNVVQEVNILDSKDEANLRLLKRPELGVTFTKLHCWRLTQFDKCVFLDADTLVLKNCDELFNYEEFSAAPDVGWPDCFNSGVFVFCPSNGTYEKLVAFAIDKGSFDGGDQGLLNLYFSDWAHKDISKHLPFIYNMCSTACYSYLPAFKQFGINVKIVHFIGSSKPWLQYFNSETKEVEPSGDLQHLRSVLQCWWNLFCAQIHPNLSTDMIWRGSSTESNHLVVNPNTSEPHNFSELTVSDSSQVSHYKDDWDPWEEYDNNKIETQLQSEPPSSQINNAKTEIFKSHNTNSQSSNVPQHIPPPITQTQNLQTPNIPISTMSFTSQLTTSLPSISNVSQLIIPSVSHPIVPTVPSPPIPSVSQPIIPIVPTPTTTSHSNNSTNSTTSNMHDTINRNTHSKQDHTHVINCTPTEILVHNTSNTRRDPDPELPLECEASTVTKDCLSYSKANDEVPDNGGLAGAFAQLTLGSPRSPAQNALEDHLRRQGWEVGHIDYLGRDSFDNIWNKICETLSAGPPPQAKETTALEVAEPQPKLETAEIAPAPIEAVQDPTKVEQPAKIQEEPAKCDASLDSAKQAEKSTEPDALQKTEEPSKPLEVKIESEPKKIETKEEAPKPEEPKPIEEVSVLAQEAPKIPEGICKLPCAAPIPTKAEAAKLTETPPKAPEKTVKAIEEITKLCEKASEVAATVIDGGLKITEQVPLVAEDALKLAEQTSKEAPKTEAPKTSEEAPKISEETPMITEEPPKISQEATKKTEEAPKKTEEALKLTEQAPKVTEEAPKVTEEAPKIIEEAQKVVEEPSKKAEEVAKAVEEAPKVEATSTTGEAVKSVEKATADIIKLIEEIPKASEEVPKAAEKVIQPIEAPKPKEPVKPTQEIPKTLEEMLKIETQVVPKEEIIQTEVIPVVDEIKPTDTTKAVEAQAKSPEKEEAKSKGKKGSKGEGKGHKQGKEAPKPPEQKKDKVEPLKSKTPPKDGEKEGSKLLEKEIETPKCEAPPKGEKKAKVQEQKEKEIPQASEAIAPKTEEKVEQQKEVVEPPKSECPKKSKQPNKSPKPIEATSEAKAESTAEVPKAGDVKKDAKKCPKKCPVKKDCPKDECQECPEKSCPKEPTGDVPKTPEVIEATPPTTPAAEKPLEEKALSAETTPPPAGAAAPTPPPRKSSSGNKKSKAKK